MDDVFNTYMEGQLKSALEEVEMPESHYEKARTSYGSLKAHLERADSSLAAYDPEIFLQGSIRTGTAIKPITDEGSYDVDAVCNLRRLGKDDITQKGLKELVGNEIKSYALSRSMSNPPHNGKRCWTLEYVDDDNFHIDVLPTISDEIARISAIAVAGLDAPRKTRFMAYTNKRHEFYDSKCVDWPSTNPIGYASWFFDVACYEERRKSIAAAEAKPVDEITPDQVKSPLQQYVQLLKRHRDVFFDSKKSLIPVKSIVITTIAARAYEKLSVKKGWYSDFVSVAATMPCYIERIGDGYRLLNPSDPLENFLAEWGENEAKSFRFWCEAVAAEIAPKRESLKQKLFGKNLRRVLRRSLGVTEDGGKLAKPPSADARYVTGLSHHRMHDMTEIDAVEVTISATKTRNGGMPKPFKSGELLPKNVNLQFTAHAHDIKNFHVRWQVTNDGIEAQRAHCLRGDFYEGSTLSDGRRTRSESTSYAGRHYVECILERDDVVYGRSEPFVVEIAGGSTANFNW